jgi:hypothetical protein
MCNLSKLAQKSAQQHLVTRNHARIKQCLEFVSHDDAIKFLTKNNFMEMAAEFHQKHGKIRISCHPVSDKTLN